MLIWLQQIIQPQQNDIPLHEVQYIGRPAEAVQVSVSLKRVDPSSSNQVSVQVHLDEVIDSCFLQCQ